MSGHVGLQSFCEWHELDYRENSDTSDFKSQGRHDPNPRKQTASILAPGKRGKPPRRSKA